MVQLRSFHERHGTNSWWKLESGQEFGTRVLLNDLKDMGYPCKTKRLARLRKLYVYAQCGSLSYEGLPLRELKLYAAQRGLSVTVGQKATIALLKEQLEQADEDATFRLPDLPPELRKIIFSHYFNSLIGSDSADLRCLPPITHASRLTREEALPLLFDRSTFTFHYVSETDPHGYRTTSYLIRKLGSWGPAPGPYALTPHAQGFMSQITARDFALIRKFTIRIDDLALVVDLENDGFTVEITTPPYVYGLTKSLFQPLWERLIARAGQLLNRIVAREGAQKLRKADVEALCKVVQNFHR